MRFASYLACIYHNGNGTEKLVLQFYVEAISFGAAVIEAEKTALMDARVGFISKIECLITPKK